jgi:hypothetical protein
MAMATATHRGIAMLRCLIRIIMMGSSWRKWGEESSFRLNTILTL